MHLVKVSVIRRTARISKGYRTDAYITNFGGILKVINIQFHGKDQNSLIDARNDERRRED